MPPTLQAGMSFFNVNRGGKPIIVVVDADSFEVQIYQRMPQYAHTNGKPCVVSDDNRIVSASPEAKTLGISRNLGVRAAMVRCKDLLLIPKGRRFDKPDNKCIRIASYKIRQQLVNFTEGYRGENGYFTASVPIENNGCDEFFMDLTRLVDTDIDNSHCLHIDITKKIIMEGKEASYRGESLDDRLVHYVLQEEFKHFRLLKGSYFREEYRLAVAAQIMNEMVEQIKKETGFVCSVGIGRNRVISKIACKLNKPHGITAMTDEGLLRVSEKFCFRDIQGLGGDLGAEVEDMWGLMSMAQLRRRTENFDQLVSVIGHDKAAVIKELAHGRCDKPVVYKFMNNVANCRKNNLRFNDESEFKMRLSLLAQELFERIQEEEKYNKRRPMQINFEYTYKLNRRPRKFELKLPKNQEGELINLSVSSIFAAAVEESVRKNLSFEDHLHGIVTMNLGVSKFHIFEEFYEDKMMEIAEDIQDWIRRD